MSSSTASCTYRIVRSALTTTTTYLLSPKHARTHLRAHAARPQAQAIPGAHPGMDMHNESLVTGHPNDSASAPSPLDSHPARLLCPACLDRTVELPLDTPQ